MHRRIAESKAARAPGGFKFPVCVGEQSEKYMTENGPGAKLAIVVVRMGSGGA
jgi:hypothetical protein